MQNLFRSTLSRSLQLTSRQALRPSRFQAVSGLNSLNQVRPISISSILRKDEDRVAEAKQELAKGNTAHAYGLSPDAGAIGEANVISKYGVLPLVGFGLAAAVSKEWLILNEEILVAFCFGSFVSAAYIFMGDSVGEGLDAESKEIQREAEGVFDELAGAVRTHIEGHKANAAIAEDARDLIDHYYSLLGRLEGAYYRKLQQETADLLTDRLQYLHSVEQKTTSAYAQNIANSSESYIRDAFDNAPKELKDKIVEASLASLAGKGSGEDPLKVLYDEYFTKVNALAKDYQAKPRPIPENIRAELREELTREKNKAAELGIDTKDFDVEPPTHSKAPHPRVALEL